jgi:RNA polymerase sigma factor (sigma-70 family)
MDTDLEWFERWRAGDRAAGEELFRKHFASIYRLFRHKVGSDADELTQRTFLACVRARDQFRGHSTFRSYLFAIARNELFAYLRRLRREEHVDFGVSSIADLVPSPSSELRKAEQMDQLRAALRHLPVEQQLLLELHYWHGFNATALGETLGATAEAVRVRLVRARQALRKQLARLGKTNVRSDEPAGGTTDRLAAALAALEADDVVE